MSKPRKPTEDAEDGDRVAKTIRFPRDLFAEAEALAAADDRTLNSYVVKAVREFNHKRAERDGVTHGGKKR